MFPQFLPANPEDKSKLGGDPSFPGRRGVNTHPKAKVDSHHELGALGCDTWDKSDVEHIAGPGCRNLDGYNGHNISGEEMRGCLTLQCLVRKPPVDATL